MARTHANRASHRARRLGVRRRHSRWLTNRRRSEDRNIDLFAKTGPRLTGLDPPVVLTREVILIPCALSTSVLEAEFRGQLATTVVGERTLRSTGSHSRG